MVSNTSQIAKVGLIKIYADFGESWTQKNRLETQNSGELISNRFEKKKYRLPKRQFVLKLR